MASLIIDGKRREVPVAEDESILDAALRAGMDLPFACKGGMCSTCRAKLVEGEAQMEVNYSLEPWELKAGFILTCQARPVRTRSWWITIMSNVIPGMRSHRRGDGFAPGTEREHCTALVLNNGRSTGRPQ